MARSAWSCSNPECVDPETGRRPVLGYVKHGSSLSLIADAISGIHADQIAGQTAVVCRRCGEMRVFKRGPVHLVIAVAIAIVTVVEEPAEQASAAMPAARDTAA